MYKGSNIIKIPLIVIYKIHFQIVTLSTEILGQAGDDRKGYMSPVFSLLPSRRFVSTSPSNR